MWMSHVTQRWVMSRTLKSHMNESYHTESCHNLTYNWRDSTPSSTLHTMRYSKFCFFSPLFSLLPFLLRFLPLFRLLLLALLQMARLAREFDSNTSDSPLPNLTSRRTSRIGPKCGLRHKLRCCKKVTRKKNRWLIDWSPFWCQSPYFVDNYRSISAQVPISKWHTSILKE